MDPLASPGKAASPAAPVILVADDNMVIRMAIKSVLERHGFRCVLAENGRRALSIILNDRPNGVVLDVNMPNMDGFEVVRQMRASERAQTIPVLLTGSRDQEAVAIGIRLGNDYMTKPFQPNELVTRLRRLLQ